MTYAIECEQNNKQELGTLQLDIRMIYSRDPTHDKKKLAACNEVAVVFVAVDDGDPPI